MEMGRDKMRVNGQMALRKIAGENVLIPIGEMMNTFQGIMSLNGSGLFLWDLLQQERSEAELITAMLETYEVDAETAAKDVREFLAQLEQANVLIR